MQITSKKYKINSPLLQNLIQFFWVIDDNIPSLNHKLLPIKNIDLIINYEDNGATTNSNKENVNKSKVYFTGLQDRDHFNWQKDSGNTFIIGIAFKPYGYFPFINIPINEFKNSVIDFSLIDKKMSELLLNSYSPNEPIINTLNRIENILLQQLEYKFLNNFTFPSIFESFKNSLCNVDVFCEISGINKRTFERDFNKFVGLSPKNYKKLFRFRDTINDITYQNYESFSELAYKNGYYDQMHFIRDFKNFTGELPSTYTSEKKTIKQLSVLE